MAPILYYSYSYQLLHHLSFPLEYPASSSDIHLSLRYRTDPRNGQAGGDIDDADDPEYFSVILDLIPSDQQIHDSAKVASGTGNACDET